MTDVHIDMTQLKNLARDIRRAEPEVAKGFRLGLKGAGEIVASAARSEASFSSRIPGSIRVLASGTRVRVRAGGARAPHAPAFEHGGQPGSFRHPVFGNRDVWVEQTAHPFLGPAAEHNIDKVSAAVVDVVGVALKRLNL